MTYSTSKFIFSLSLLLGVGSSALAQINSNIPLMVQPPRFDSPILQMQQIEAARAQAAQARLMEEQARALENQNRQNQSQQNQRQQQQPNNAPSEKVMADWYKAAQPRLYLYPDFDKVVYASDVTITTDMIKLMSGSPYAADITYYFGTHKTEASAIAQMPLLEQSQAILKIEQRIKASQKKASK